MLFTADVDECVNAHTACDKHARCGNVVGSYFCQCDKGYSGTGFVCYGKNNFYEVVKY